MSIFVAVIGLGNIGLLYDYHLTDNVIETHSKAVFLHPRAILSAGVDTNDLNRTKFAQKYGKSTFSNISELIKSNLNFDTAIIATPTSSLVGCVHQLLQDDRIKNLLIEKPVTQNLNEFYDLICAIKQKNIRCAVNFFRPSLPIYSDLSKKISDGYFGKLLGGHFYYSKGLIHNASHLINLIQFFFQNTELNLVKSGVATSTKYPADIDINFKIILESSEIFVQSVDYKLLNIFYGDLLFENGLLSIHDDGALIKIRDVKTDIFSERKLGSEAILDSQFDKYQGLFFDDFVNFCFEKKNNICTLEKAFDTMMHIDNLMRTTWK